MNEPLQQIECYICHQSLYRADAGNWAGHFAHHSCILKANTPRGEPSPITPIPAVPRMWEAESDPVTPSTLVGDIHFNPDTHTMVGMVFPTELIEDGPNSKDILDEVRFVAELLLTKNRAYGSSFALPLNVWSKLDPVEAINARLDDKLARIKQARDFSEDTDLDIIGYLILKRIAMRMATSSSVVDTPASVPSPHGH